MLLHSSILAGGSAAGDLRLAAIVILLRLVRQHRVKDYVSLQSWASPLLFLETRIVTESDPVEGFQGTKGNRYSTRGCGMLLGEVVSSRRATEHWMSGR